MGGYSEQCKINGCGKWFLNPRAIKDHVRDKHPIQYPGWKIRTGRVLAPWHFSSLHGIPKDKLYPPTAVQCDSCGGYGCEVCSDRGWLREGHEKGRRCAYGVCSNEIAPNWFAVYCSNECALADSYALADS